MTHDNIKPAKGNAAKKNKQNNKRADKVYVLVCPFYFIRS